MAEGGFDPNDPNGFETNEDTPYDDPSNDIPLTDITKNDTEFPQPEGSQKETSFITPKGSQASRFIESYRCMFKNKYGIDDKTFGVLRLDLELRGSNLYYEDAQIMRKDGKGLYSLGSIKGKGAVEFKRIVEEGQRRVQARLIEGARRSKQPIEPTVVDKQSRTFDNQAFDGGDDNELTSLLNAGELPPDIFDDSQLEMDKTPGIHPETLREIEGLTENLTKTKSNSLAAYVELLKEKGDIGVIKDELERERAKDKLNQNKIKYLNEDIKQREKYITLLTKDGTETLT